MTKQELINDFALFEAFDHLLSIVKTQLLAGNSVALGQDFGEFTLRTQAARSGEANGTPYSTPAKTVAKFRVSAPFKAALAST